MLEHVFSPTQVGPLKLKNRIMIPPHAAVVGDMWGDDVQANINLSYWESRAADGAGWLDGITGFIENTIVPPGFVPTGTGARIKGVYHLPVFRERAGRYADAAHKNDAVATCQLVIQGGKPHAPSNKLANYTDNYVPHAMTLSEIRWLIDEYLFAAREAKAAGLDGVELHANHEDLLQLFMSPATNERDDEYGGDFDRRLKIVKDIITGIRDELGPEFAIGIRFNMDEFFEGGYDSNEGTKIAKSLEATGAMDYLHGVVGNNWGAPSYLQPHHYALHEWSDLASKYRDELNVPVVYAGRVSTIQAAEEVIKNGQADVVAMARAMFADEHLVSKAMAGKVDDIRPCIGCNDCLHGRIVERLPFACSVNPTSGQETQSIDSPQKLKSLLVIGGGPAGMELAIRAAERGHQVSLWERSESLGGQLKIAAAVEENRAYLDYVRYQERQLSSLGVQVSVNTQAELGKVLAENADVVAVATGSKSRKIDVPGAHLPFVLDGRDVMAGQIAGKRVLLIAQEDHMQPLTIASYLASHDHDVTVVYQTHGIAPLVGKYSVGAALGKLSSQGVKFRVMERVTRIEQGAVEVKNIYSDVADEISDFDTVVLACGGDPEDGLYRELEGQVDELHLLGDAYAPRRILFATQQAFHLAALI